MKTSINIAKCLRILFGVARALTIILPTVVIVLYAIMGLIRLKENKPNYLRILVPELHLKLNEGALTIQTETSEPSDIRIGTLMSSLSVNTKSKDHELGARAQWAMVPVWAFNFTYYFLLFGFLRRLCANLEAGEMFNDTNLRLVRNIGRLLVICALVGEALDIMLHYTIANYLTQHAKITGLNASLGSSILQHVQISSLVTGLLVLLIAEAFRQGLALKKENDLVV